MLLLWWLAVRCTSSHIESGDIYIYIYMCVYIERPYITLQRAMRGPCNNWHRYFKPISNTFCHCSLVVVAAKGKAVANDEWWISPLNNQNICRRYLSKPSINMHRVRGRGIKQKSKQRSSSCRKTRIISIPPPMLGVLVVALAGLSMSSNRRCTGKF